MRVLSLFSGGGLGDYGLDLAGMEIVGQVEIDDYCQKILKLRWPDVPKWTDIKNVTGKEVLKQIGTVDLISGGFPCQPFSVAGKRKGKNDNRNLWPEMFRIIKEIKPRYIFAENVRGIVNSYLDTVLTDLENQGYSCSAFLIPASAVGAPHRRERLWIVAYTASKQSWRLRITELQSDFGTSCKVADAEESSRNGKTSGKQQGKVRGRSIQSNPIRNPAIQRLPDWAGGAVEQPLPLTEFERPSGREIERDFRGISHGVANRVHRLKLLGNGQVIQVVEWIGKRIMEFELMKEKV